MLPVFRIGALLVTLASHSLLRADPVPVVSTNQVAEAQQPQAAVAPDGEIFVVFGADESVY